MDEQEIEEHYREMEVLDWLRTHPGQHSMRELVDALEPLSPEQVNLLVSGLAQDSINVRWVADELDGVYEWVNCPGCGSPAPYGGCDIECDFGHCPGPDCDFLGHLLEHVEESGSNPGYTGASIYWTTFRCGYQDVDASRDSAEAAR